MLILAIESSCDETSAAVIKNGREVLSNIISSQIDIHKKFGGVVPEIASRSHIESITIVGLCTDICVISNALILRAYLPNTPIICDASCCAGTTPEAHKAALTVMKSCQIDVINE